jgi:hypothetical protein
MVSLFFIICHVIRVNNTFKYYPEIDTKKASFSLTTIPSRFKHIEPTIKSLIAQNPKTIYLNVPYELKKTKEKYVIPDWLDKYTETGEVTLVRTEDKGPITKVMGLFDTQIEPEEYIIVVDDDHVYNNLVLSNLLHTVENSKIDKVICCLPSHGTLTGFSGFIFKRRLIDDLPKFVFPTECFEVDDMTLTRYFNYKKIPIEGLFSVNINNISTSKTPNNTIEFLKMIASPEREITHSINPLYVHRGSKNIICYKKLNQLIGPGPLSDITIEMFFKMP